MKAIKNHVKKELEIMIEKTGMDFSKVEFKKQEEKFVPKEVFNAGDRILYVPNPTDSILLVGMVADDLDNGSTSIHIKNVPSPVLHPSSCHFDKKLELNDGKLIKDDNDLYKYLAKNDYGKGFVITDSFKNDVYKGEIKIEPVQSVSVGPQFDGESEGNVCVITCEDQVRTGLLKPGQEKPESFIIAADKTAKVHFVPDIDSAFKLVKDICDIGFNLTHHVDYAVKNPKQAYLEIKDHYFMINYKIDSYIEGLAKTNKENHYLDELLYESCIESNEPLFEKLVNAGADLSWRRFDYGKPINILHYTAADLLSTATELVIDRLVEEGKIDLLTELLNENNFENLSPNEVWKMRVGDVEEIYDDEAHYARDLHFLASQKIDEYNRKHQTEPSLSQTEETDVVKEFFGKVKEILPQKVEIDGLFKVAATVLNGYNSDEKSKISSYLIKVGGDNKNNLGKFLSEVLDVTPSMNHIKKSKSDDFERQR